PRGFSFRPKICTNCPETVASGNAGAEAIGSSRLANTALRTLVVPELKLFRPHRAPKITQLSCRRRCVRTCQCGTSLTSHALIPHLHSSISTLWQSRSRLQPLG